MEGNIQMDALAVLGTASTEAIVLKRNMKSSKGLRDEKDKRTGWHQQRRVHLDVGRKA